MGTNFNTAAYVLEASHVPKFPGDYKPMGPTTFIFHLFLFAEHDQLTILTREGSLQTSLLILYDIWFEFHAHTHPHTT